MTAFEVFPPAALWPSVLPPIVTALASLLPHQPLSRTDPSHLAEARFQAERRLPAFSQS
ncbi:MAG: hypothetical protein WA459_04015 [Stellaceae bacterium]